MDPMAVPRYEIANFMRTCHRNPTPARDHLNTGHRRGFSIEYYNNPVERHTAKPIDPVFFVAFDPDNLNEAAFQSIYTRHQWVLQYEDDLKFSLIQGARVEIPNIKKPMRFDDDRSTSCLY